MPDQRIPAFARMILGQTDESARTSILEHVHADYAAYAEGWQVLIDAFEGSGGFANGEYLWRYKNEVFDDYQARQAMARYHNYVETIVDLYVRHIFSQAPTRSTSNEDLKAFWEDVDGAGTDMDTFLRRALAIALAGAHVAILMDVTRDEPTGPAKADQRARPFLTLYASTSVLDWRLDHDTLTGVKLREVAPPNSIAEEAHDVDEAYRYLIWDEEGWARFSHKGVLIDADTPGLALVPLAVLRPKPSVLRPFIGRPLFSNPQIVQALFNRHSELDEVLRSQAFSQLTVEVPEGGDVEAARKQLGTEFGTSRAICVQGKIKFESPDMAVPAAVEASIANIVRELYRISHMRFARESLDAESAEAIRLQYSELNEMLQGCAAALTFCETQLTRFFFAWTSPTPEAAESACDAAEVTIEYADEFFLDDLLTDLTAWAQAIKFDLGDTMTKRIKKRAVRRIEPEMPADVLEDIDKEIDAQPAMETMAQQGEAMRQSSQGMLQALGVQTPERDRVVVQ